MLVLASVSLCTQQVLNHKSSLVNWLFPKPCLPPASDSTYNLLPLVLLTRFSYIRLCDPIDGSPPGSPIPGILQARTLEWAAISFSNAWQWKAKVKSLSRVWLFETPWTAAHQAPPSMGFSRQEYWGWGAISPSKYPSLTLSHGGQSSLSSTFRTRPENLMCKSDNSEWDQSSI